MDVIIFTSSLHDTSLLDKKRMDAIQRYLGGRELHFINYYDGLDVAADAVCFIATGGTEELFSRIWEKIPQPVVLLSDGYHNSFAAAREIASFLQQRSVRHTLVNLPIEECAPYPASGIAPATGSTPALDPYSDGRVVKALASSRIGLIGGASSWLISSGIDREAVCTSFGCEFIDIPISEVEEEYRNTATGEISEEAATYSREALSDAERMYRALKTICSRYRLTALTIKCFDLLGSCHTTSCLALSRLSDEGIISGCEGDIPSLWTLLVARALCGHPAFMANPSSSCEAECTVDFAHCTIPISMCLSYTLPSHFESGIGIGVAGRLEPGPCKLLKIGGSTLQQVYHAEGEIICNTNYQARCRTQVRFRFPSRAEFDRFMASRLGNHIILYR